MWWLILLIPLILLVLLLFLKVRLCLIYEDDFSVKVKVLIFNIPLFPQKKKKTKTRAYSKKALQKKQDRLNKKAEKKKKKQKPEPPADPAEEKSKSEKLKDILGLIKMVLENVMSPFGRYLKVEIIKMHITVGNDDPAKTAVMYGGICQAASYVIELLSNLTNVDVKRKNSIDIRPDFFEGKTTAKINITLGLRVWHALSLAIKFFMGYLKHKGATAQPKSENNNT